MKYRGGNWPTLFQLFWAFFKIGPMSFGGGFAMIPVFEREMVKKREWVTAEELTDVLAASQTIPGAVAINSSAMIGYRKRGVMGAIAAAAGMLMPTFMIVLVLGISFSSIQGIVKIQAALEGIRPAVVALIAFAGYRIFKTSNLDKTSFILMLGTGTVLLTQWVSPTVIILLGGLLGIGIISIKTKFSRSSMASIESAF